MATARGSDCEATLSRRRKNKGARSSTDLVRNTPFRPTFDRPDANFANPDCYARCLGNCTAKTSKEHFFTYDLLRKVTIDPRGLHLRGAPWKPDGHWLQPESVGAPILCEQHNAALSPLDAFASSLDDELHRINVAAAERRKISTVARFFGPNLERWLMKTLCGFATARRATLEVNTADPLVPEAWVRYLFGQVELQPPMGLYLSSTPGERVHIDPYGFTFTTLYARGTLAGLMVDIRNVRLMFVAVPWNGTLGGVFTEHTVRRPWRLSFQSDVAMSLVELEWPQKSGREVLFKIAVDNAPP
jgi:hypothetical protein